MAIVWQKRLNGKTYQVRSAGRTRRLYTDGVLHSQFHPQRAQTGGIWDLLWLPALLHPTAGIDHALVLGVGGGSAIRQLNRYLRPRKIIGVELNPVHLHVARHFFGVMSTMARLIEADAVSWLREYRGPPFDLIIDDLFGEDRGEPVRAVPATPHWCEQLQRHLTDDGVLAMNFLNSSELRDSPWVTHKRLWRTFKSSLQLTSAGYENAIGAMTRMPVDGKILRRRMAAIPELASAGLNFRIRRLNRG